MQKLDLNRYALLSPCRRGRAEPRGRARGQGAGAVFGGRAAEPRLGSKGNCPRRVKYARKFRRRTSTHPDLPWATAGMHLAIRPLDVSSDADVVQYGALDEAVDQHSFGGFERYSLGQRRAALTDSPCYATRRWVAVAELMEGGEALVGQAALFPSQPDNLDTVSAGVGVHPDFRGLGIGAALLEDALIPAVRETGRSLIQAWAEIPAEGDLGDPAIPAVRLAARLGISPQERRRRAVAAAADRGRTAGPAPGRD